MRDATEQYSEDVDRDTFRQRHVMKAAKLETYLVAVELPLEIDSAFITVTDDYDGFGPGVLAAFPIKRLDAATPQDAAWDYALLYQLFPILAIVNLSDEYSEWQLTAEGKYEQEEEE